MITEMKTVEFSLTPHNTCRVFLKKEMVIKNDDLTNLLNSISVWGGADWKDDTHIAWELPIEFAEKMKKFAEKYTG